MQTLAAASPALFASQADSMALDGQASEMGCVGEGLHSVGVAHNGSHQHFLLAEAQNKAPRRKNVQC